MRELELQILRHDPSLLPATSDQGLDLAPTSATAAGVGVDPLASSFGYGALWVANGDSGTVAVIRPGAPAPVIVPRIPSPYGISAGAGGIWVASNGMHAVYRIDPDTHAVVARIDLGTPTDFLYGVSARRYGVWAIEDRHLVRIDPATDRVVVRIRFLRPGHGRPARPPASSASWFGRTAFTRGRCGLFDEVALDECVEEADGREYDERRRCRRRSGRW